MAFLKSGKKDGKKATEEITSSANRRTMDLDVKKIKQEIEQARIKAAEEEAIARAEAEAEGLEAGDLRLFKPKDEVDAPEETKASTENAKPAKSGIVTGVEDAGDETGEIANDDAPDGDDAEGEKPVAAANIIEVEPEPTWWQKILGTGKRKNYILGFGVVLPIVLVLGYLFYITLGWREWPGNLVILSIPVLVGLTYLFDHYAQPQYWEEYEHVKILRYENRQDAAVILPLILFMGVLSLNSNMLAVDAVIYYARFVFLAALIWSGLIWLTRRVPPPRVRK